MKAWNETMIVLLVTGLVTAGAVPGRGERHFVITDVGQ